MTVHILSLHQRTFGVFMQRFIPVLVPALVASVVVSTSASAQVCRGTAPFINSSTQLGVGTEFTDGVSAYSANLMAGHDGGAFGGISGGTMTYDGTSERSWLLGVSAGYETSPTAESRTQVCPLISATFGFGPEADGVKMRMQTGMVGAGVGVRLGKETGVQVIPGVGAGIVVSRVALSGFGESISTTETYALFTTGFGIVLTPTVTVGPTASFPVGLEGADPSYGLALSVNLRNR